MSETVQFRCQSHNTYAINLKTYHDQTLEEERTKKLISTVMKHQKQSRILRQGLSDMRDYQLEKKILREQKERSVTT